MSGVPCRIDGVGLSGDHLVAPVVRSCASLFGPLVWAAVFLLLSCKGIVMSSGSRAAPDRCLASLFALCSPPALAERPMAVDDANTLERGA